MPTLDDAPIIEQLVVSGTSGGGSPVPLSSGGDAGDSNAPTEIAKADLIQVFDVSEQKVKTITVQAFAISIGTDLS